MGPQQYLFAYGTLRRDYFPDLVSGLRDRLVFIGEAVTTGVLFDMGNYPGAVRRGEHSTIKGDVFLLPEAEPVLKVLDAFEGIPQAGRQNAEFLRKEIQVTLDGGKILEAWIYWYNWDTGGKPLIASGDYLAYLKTRNYYNNLF